MSVLYLTVVTSPLLWLGLGFLAVLLVLQHVEPPKGTSVAVLAPKFSEKSGLNALAWFAVNLTPIWFALLIATVWTLGSLWSNPPGQSEVLANRVHYLAIVGLITALAGLVGTPLAMIRVFTNERQTTATEEGLITDRINKAVEGLGAEKTIMEETEIPQFQINDKAEAIPVTNPNGSFMTIRKYPERTAPNHEVRIGAIYALERISQDSPRDHVQIKEILCAYIRENAPIESAKKSDYQRWHDLVGSDADVMPLNSEEFYSNTGIPDGAASIKG